MDELGMTVGLVIALAMVAVAAYFAWLQQLTLRTLHVDPRSPSAQHRFLLKQCVRRLFGSVVLIVLAFMLVGSLFLNYDPAQIDDVRILTFYLATMLLLVLVILTLAIFDFWATARNGVRLHKELFQEHQEILEAELEEFRQRQAENDSSNSAGEFRS